VCPDPSELGFDAKFMRLPDLKLVAFLLGGAIIMLGVVADRMR
jgi:hypothetical protein